MQERTDQSQQSMQMIAKQKANHSSVCKYVTQGHKPSHKGQFFLNSDLYIHESWMNKRSINEWFVMIGQYLAEIQLFKNL